MKFNIYSLFTVVSLIGAAPFGAVVVAATGVAGVLGPLDAHSW